MSCSMLDSLKNIIIMKIKDLSIEGRKEGIILYITNPKIIFPIILILLVLLGVYTRVLPMTAHGPTPGLWDQTTNDWTLGPDLDPWSFVKQAKTIANDGRIPAIDPLRNVPRSEEHTSEL